MTECESCRNLALALVDRLTEKELAALSLLKREGPMNFYQIAKLQTRLAFAVTLTMKNLERIGLIHIRLPQLTSGNRSVRLCELSELGQLVVSELAKEG